MGRAGRRATGGSGAAESDRAGEDGAADSDGAPEGDGLAGGREVEFCIVRRVEEGADEGWPASCRNRRPLRGARPPAAGAGGRALPGRATDRVGGGAPVARSPAVRAASGRARPRPGEWGPRGRGAHHSRQRPRPRPVPLAQVRAGLPRRRIAARGAAGIGRGRLRATHRRHWARAAPRVSSPALAAAPLAIASPRD